MPLTWDEVRQICSQMALELTGVEDDSLSADVSSVVFRVDTFGCGDTAVTDRHIDVEYSFGECYEIQKDTPLFQFICTLCPLPPEQEGDVTLYEAP